MIFLFIFSLSQFEFVTDLDERPAGSHISQLVSAGGNAYFIYDQSLMRWNSDEGLILVQEHVPFSRVYPGGDEGFFYLQGFSIFFWDLYENDGRKIGEWEGYIDVLATGPGHFLFETRTHEDGVWLSNLFLATPEGASTTKVLSREGFQRNTVVFNGYVFYEYSLGIDDKMAVFDVEQPNQIHEFTFRYLQGVFIRGDSLYVMGLDQIDQSVLYRLSPGNGLELVFSNWFPYRDRGTIMGPMGESDWPMLLYGPYSETADRVGFFLLKPNATLEYLGDPELLGQPVAYSAPLKSFLFKREDEQGTSSLTWVGLNGRSIETELEKAGYWTVENFGSTNQGIVLQIKGEPDPYYSAQIPPELWFIDADGQARQLISNDESVWLRPAVQLDDTVQFWVEEGSSGMFLWRTDGSLEHTERVPSSHEISLGTSYYQMNSLVIDDQMLFHGFTDQYGQELLVSDGESIRLVSDLKKGRVDNMRHVLMKTFGEELYFTKATAEKGAELWVAEEDGVRLVDDLFLGAGGSNPGSMETLNNQLFVSARSRVGNQSLFRLDPDNGFIPVENEPTVSRHAEHLFRYGDFLYFSGFDYCTGAELMRSDGSPDGTRLVANLAADFFDHPYCYSESSAPDQFRSWNGALFFRTSPWASHTWWRFKDDLLTGMASWYDDELLFGREYVYVLNSDAEHSGVWFVDAFGSELQFLMELPEPVEGEFDYDFLLSLVQDTLLCFKKVRVNESFRLIVYAAEHGGEWHRILDEPMVDHYSSGFVVFPETQENARYFSYTHPQYGNELFRLNSDLTISPLGDLQPGEQGSAPHSLAVVNGTFFFTAETSELGRELWMIRFQADRAELVADLLPGADSSNPRQVLAVGDSLYVEADHANLGSSLFKMEWNQASAGPDQSTCGHETTLQAFLPKAANGFWQVLEGFGGVFDDETDASTRFNGEPNESYLLRWTIQMDGGAILYDDMIVEFSDSPEGGSGGLDQILCLKTRTELQAVQPIDGYGKWHVLQGDVLLQDSYDPNSQLTLLQPFQDSYKLEWVQSNGQCEPVADQVTIRAVNPTTWPIGQRDYFCEPIAQLHAPSAPGTLGTWSVSHGEGGTFSDIHDPNAIFEGERGTNYYLIWSIESEECGRVDLTRRVFFLREHSYAIEGPSVARIGEEITLSVTQGPSTYMWSTGGSTHQETIRVTGSMEVTLVMTSIHGCEYIMTHQIHAIEDGRLSDQFERP